MAQGRPDKGRKRRLDPIGPVRKRKDTEGADEKPPQAPPARRDTDMAKGRPSPGGAPPRGGGGARRGPPPGKGKKGRARGPRGPRQEFDPVVRTMDPEPLPALQKEARRMRVFREVQTDPAYGKRPEARTVEELLRFGVVVLDKPVGPTSHQVVAWLRDELGVDKVGHGGTLDPKVSGVLPTTIGDATKTAKSLLTAGKEYVAVMRLHGDAPEDKIRDEARRFIGVVRQVPPVRSAVARRQRERRIYDLEVLDIDGRDVLLRIACEAGTYIRNLCVDLGKAIGVRGHMAELRRIRTGTLGEDELVTLHDVKDALHFWREDGDERFIRRCVRPFERVLAHLPRIIMRDSAVAAVCHGADLAAPGVVAMEEGIQPKQPVVLYSGKGEAVALGRATMTTEAAETAKTGIVVGLERVLMPSDVYPATWKGRKATVGRGVTRDADDLGVF